MPHEDAAAGVARANVGEDDMIYVIIAVGAASDRVGRRVDIPTMRAERMRLRLGTLQNAQWRPSSGSRSCSCIRLHLLITYL